MPDIPSRSMGPKAQSSNDLRSLTNQHPNNTVSLQKSQSAKQFHTMKPSPAVFDGKDEQIETATYGGKAASICKLTQNQIETEEKRY